MSKFALNTAPDARYLRRRPGSIRRQGPTASTSGRSLRDPRLRPDERDRGVRRVPDPVPALALRHGVRAAQQELRRTASQKIYELVINNNPCVRLPARGQLAHRPEARDGPRARPRRLLQEQLLLPRDGSRRAEAHLGPDEAPRPVRPRSPLDRQARQPRQPRRPPRGAPRHQQGRGVHRSVLVAREPDRPLVALQRARPRRTRPRTTKPVAVPRIEGQGVHGRLHQPARSTWSRRRRKLETQKTERKYPARPERDVLKFLLDHAPLERWERDVLEVVRDEAYYFVPQKPDQDHERGLGQLLALPIMTEKLLEASEIIDYADANAGVMATAPGRLQPLQARRRALPLHRGALEPRPVRQGVGGVRRSRRAP
jgi:hypothetical protein